MHPIILCVFVFIFYNSASASVISRLNQIIFDFQIPWDLIFPISRQTKWHAKLNARNKIIFSGQRSGVNLAQLSTSWPSCWNSCYLRNGPTQRPFKGSALSGPLGFDGHHTSPNWLATSSHSDHKQGKINPVTTIPNGIAHSPACTVKSTRIRGKNFHQCLFCLL